MRGWVAVADGPVESSCDKFAMLIYDTCTDGDLIDPSRVRGLLKRKTHPFFIAFAHFRLMRAGSSDL
jgi:hypothetical protein